MDTARIAELLQPFFDVPNPNPFEDRHSEPSSCHSEQSEESAVLTQTQLQNISTYIDMLLHWNARINLTAIRGEEEIVTRHFGESLFAARHLFPSVARAPSPASVSKTKAHATRLIDIGSGAGFPGLPIKIWAPAIELTLIESNQKKATFLREVARKLTLMNINVFAGRAESFSNSPAEVVTLRAVESFENALPIAARLVAPTGRLALLISQVQLTQAHDLTPGFKWSPPLPIPMSASRILVIGVRQT
ncbi:MAG: 16S rRNA (guanine(527)-N(7))-methyltransferase RsmG [Terriglobales bacterium]|jgi:16S rRNA (guanine527-N7)-methyltransferase